MSPYSLFPAVINQPMEVGVYAVYKYDLPVGWPLGIVVGCIDGCPLGTFVGWPDGTVDGFPVGNDVG
jgi:hypothetical protein